VGAIGGQNSMNQTAAWTGTKPFNAQAVGYIRTSSSRYDWIPIQIDKGKGKP